MRKIATYERFQRHVRAWADGEIDCLYVQGKPGTGKSHSYRGVLGNRPHHLFSARKSPIQVYIELHDAPDIPIVFDDISALLTDANFVDMLKGLCETGRKVLRWGTTTPKLEDRRQEFVSSSPVLIVLNKPPTKNPDVAAVLDRCDGIVFAPTKFEIINRMRVLFPEDGHLIDLMSELPIMPSLRTLIKAKQWARSRHLSLTEELFDECGVPESIGKLVAIMQHHPENEWGERYAKETGMTDRSYRRHKAIAAELLACKIGESVSDCPAIMNGNYPVVGA